jgi:hypothetical protein
MEAITREEKLLSGQQLEPITRKELFLAKAAGMDVQTPEPITREEIFLSQISGGGGGTIEPLSVTANGTYNPPEGVDGYSPVTVNVASSGDDGSFKAVIERTATEITLPSDLMSIGSHVFRSYANLGLISLPDGVTRIGDYAFNDCFNLVLESLPRDLTHIGACAFQNCEMIGSHIILGSNIDNIGSSAFKSCGSIKTVTFKRKPSTLSKSAFEWDSGITDIYVPWAEGEVSGAPWGATNATINYNYTGG